MDNSASILSNHWAYPKLPYIILQRRAMPLQRRQPRMAHSSFNESCDLDFTQKLGEI